MAKLLQVRAVRHWHSGIKRFLSICSFSFAPYEGNCVLCSMPTLCLACASCLSTNVYPGRSGRAAGPCSRETFPLEQRFLGRVNRAGALLVLPRDGEPWLCGWVVRQAGSRGH